MNNQPMSPAQPAPRARYGRLFGAAALALALALPAGLAMAEAAPAPVKATEAPAATKATEAPAAVKAAEGPASEAPTAKPVLPELKLEALPADVVSVTLLGSWSEKRERGVYRVIVVKGGPDELATRVVVQWIRQRGGDKPAVVASREIEAFNEYIGLAMVPTWRDLSHNRLQMTADVRLPDGQRKRVRVLASTPGELSDPV